MSLGILPAAQYRLDIFQMVSREIRENQMGFIYSN